MKYYNAKDIMQITGVKQNKAYEIIRQLQAQFYKKYPNAIFIKGKIIKWYFDEVMGIKEEENEISNLRK